MTNKKISIGHKNVSIVIRSHPKAKRLTLKYSYHTGSFILVTPEKFPETLIKNFIDRHYTWIEQHILAHKPLEKEFFPEKLSVFGQLKTVYARRGPRRGSFEKNDQIIIICPSAEDEIFCLEAYLRLQSKEYFTQLAIELAKKINKKVVNVQIKDQKTRWGSCSFSGKINLSWRLCLAPKDVSHYVCSHEIAHLSEMNHSKNFWSIVEFLCPDYKRHRLWLKENGASLFHFSGQNF